VVDGQHRLWGAATASAGSDIWLPVVLMPNASWVDQIYQFVIINETAKKVDTSLLTDIFGNSLTEEEAVQARKRFESSNIDVEARIAAVLADSHADSPFNGMVKWRGVGGSGTTTASNGFLNEKTIRDLIQGQGRGRGFRVDDEFYTCVVEPTIPNRDDWMNWTDGRWKDFWFAFWSEVRDYYNSEAPAGKTLWSNTVQSNLTKAVTLRQFQRLYMTQAIEKVNKAKDSRATFEDAGVPEEQVEEYVGAALQKVVLPETVEEFRESVREWFLALGVPVRVFVYDWVSSLDDAQGQDALWDELNKAYRCSQRGDRYRADGGIFAKNDG
jgi:hypothetical protein